MSDAALVNEATLERPSQGQVERASGEQSQGSTEGQTSDNGQSAKDPNIAKLQSKLDSQIADLKKQLDQKDITLQQYQNGYNALQRRIEELEDASAGNDDYAKMEIKARRAEQKAQQLETYLAQLQAEQVEATKRERAIANVAAKFGVDPGELAKTGATNYEELLDKALDLRDKQRSLDAAARQDKKERNLPTLGGGGSSTTLDRLQEELKEAGKNRDSVRQQRILRQIRQLEAASAKK